MHLLLSVFLVAAPAPAAQLNPARQADNPNILLRVCNGACPSTLQGSWGEPISYVRASAATCPNDDGTVTQLASGVPCMPKGAGGTQYGYRARQAVTNLLQFYNALGTSPWATSAGVVSAPTVTNNTTDLNAPDGTATATKIVYPQVVGASAFSLVRQPFTAAAAAWTAQTNLRTLSGTATVYLAYQLTAGGSYKTATCAVTAAWKPVGSICNEANQTLTAASWDVQIGVDLRDGAEATQAAQTVYAWGAQSEAGATPSDVVPTAGASATAVAENAITTATRPWPGAGGVFSLSADVLPSAFGSGLNYLTPYVSTTDNAQLNVLSSGVVQMFIHNGASTFSNNSTATCTAGASCHISTSFDGTNLRTCVNFQCTSSVLAVTFASTAYQMALGYYPGLGGLEAKATISNSCFDVSPWGCW